MVWEAEGLVENILQIQVDFNSSLNFQVPTASSIAKSSLAESHFPCIGLFILHALWPSNCSNYLFRNVFSEGRTKTKTSLVECNSASPLFAEPPPAPRSVAWWRLKMWPPAWGQSEHPIMPCPCCPSSVGALVAIPSDRFWSFTFGWVQA